MKKQRAQQIQPVQQCQTDAETLLDLLADGEIASVLKYQFTNFKKDQLAQKAYKLAKNIENYLDVLNGLSVGDFNRRLPSFSSKDQIGNSIAKVVESVSTTAKIASDVKLALETEKNKLLQEDWVKSQYSLIFSKIQGVKTLAELGSSVLGELSFALNAQMGAFFIKQTNITEETIEPMPTNTLNLVATYGVNGEKKRKIFNSGDGIIGQCAIDLKPRYIQNVPQDFVQIESGLGSMRPRCVVVMPIVYEGELYGVLELASIEAFSDIQKILLEQVAGSIGISIKSISGNMLTEKLLEEIAHKNNTLASQKQALDSSAIVAETDTRGRITYVNDKFLEISKYDRSELMGQDHRILNSQHHPKEFFVNLWKTISKGEVWHNEVKNRAKDGTFYWVDTTIYPVKDEYEKLQKYVAIRFDITDRKHAEEHLNAANASILSQKQALDNSAIVAETDIRGKITYVNDKFLEISKYDRSELMGQDHRILNSQHHPKEFFVNLWKTISRGDVWHNEVKNRAKDGTFYWVDTTIYPVKDEYGKLQKYVAIRFDITDKKRALEELQLATLQAKTAAKAKTEFLANMSHEIRTPMNAIIGMAELLKETPLNIDQERYVNILNNSGSALLDVINNILDLSKIEAGHLTLEKIPYDLEDVIFATTEIMDRGAHKKGLELCSYIKSDINCKQIGDPSRLRQVLINLLGNAIKFTKTGEIGLRVEKDPDRDGFMLITVSDTGIGIDQAKLEKLFKNFSQANTSTTREYGGTGLGLAISKKIVEMMGGSIGVKSVAGKGSQFYFSIPLKDQENESSIKLNASQLVGKRALIIDDNATNRLILNEMLTSWQMITAEAGSGKEALTKMKSANRSGKPFELVIVDYHMPEMNGLEVAKKISENALEHPVVIVMLTSEDKRSELGRARDMGVTSYVIKPIRRAELLKIVLVSFTKTAQKPTVLVVDDEVEIQQMIANLLQQLNVNVMTASGGNEALKILNQNNVQIVVSDLNMPKVNGLQLLEEARSKGQNQPFVFISGHMPMFNPNVIVGKGDIDFLDKPCDSNALLDLVDERLERLKYGEQRKAVSLIPSAATRPLRILIVDDVQENVDLIKVYLKKFPYSLDFASNGEEAIEQFLSSKYHLILMDIQMPVMDGHEATRRIRKIEKERQLPRTTIVSLSAHALSEEIENMLSAGADAYLTKPIKKMPLLEAIEKYADFLTEKDDVQKKSS